MTADTTLLCALILCPTIVPAKAQAPAAQPAATQPAQTVPAAPVTRVVNPHWSDAGCRYCHAAAGDEDRPIVTRETEGICLKCHDGRQALAEPHPVGRRFDSMTPPPGWPAPDNKVTCITCHEVHPGHHHRAARPAENVAFLRGYDGDPLAFCSRCHPGASEHRRHNPHVAQIKNGRIVQQSCAFCHTTPMPAGPRAVRTGEPALRADGISVCIGCHTTHLEWSHGSHMGAKVWPEMLEAAERLPLAGGDTVVCATCHNPHEQGLFAPGSVLADGAVRTDEPIEQLRGLRSKLCDTCHGQ